MATVLVVAAILIEEGRVLLTQRKKGSHLAGSWEFPGGKVEPHEDPKEALRRELVEEIGIDATISDIVEVTFHAYPEKDVLLLFYAVARRPGSPAPRAVDVADLRFAEASELHDEDFPPADVDVLRKVRRMLA